MNKVNNELDRRMKILAEYRSTNKNKSDPTGWVFLKQLRIYRGQRILYRDQSSTRHLVDDACGVAVSLRLSDEFMPDSIDKNGIIRIGLEDICTKADGECAEQSIYNAKSLGLPVFIVWRKTKIEPWVVEKTWVISRRSDSQVIEFLIDHDEELLDFHSKSTNGDFELIEDRNKTITTRSTLLRSEHFKNSVRHAYQNRCAATGLEIIETLEAAHIWPVSHGGTSRFVENGILLCANVHKAFDAHLIGINPDTMSFEDNRRGKTLKMLHVNRNALKERSNKGLVVPHYAALVKRWEATRNRWKS